MPNRSIFLAGAAALAFISVPMAGHAQQSWGTSSTTYWNLPETGNPTFGKDFNTSAAPPPAAPPADMMQYQPTGADKTQPGLRQPMRPGQPAQPGTAPK